MSGFILDRTPKIEATMTIGDTTYKLKWLKGCHYILHIMPKNSEPDTIELTQQDLKAIFLLVSDKSK